MEYLPRSGDPSINREGKRMKQTQVGSTVIPGDNEPPRRSSSTLLFVSVLCCITNIPEIVIPTASPVRYHSCTQTIISTNSIPT